MNDYQIDKLTQSDTTDNKVLPAILFFSKFYCRSFSAREHIWKTLRAVLESPCQGLSIDVRTWRPFCFIASQGFRVAPTNELKVGVFHENWRSAISLSALRLSEQSERWPQSQSCLGAPSFFYGTPHFRQRRARSHQSLESIHFIFGFLSRFFISLPPNSDASRFPLALCFF